MTVFEDEPDFEVNYDSETLRESYADESAVRARIEQLRLAVRDAADEIGELAARGELVDRLRGLGELDEALREANAAVDRAEIAGNAAQQHVARLRLAHVAQWRGEFAESTVLITELLSVADRFGPIVEAFTHQQAGLNDYDQRHFADAREHFARAVALRADLELEDDLAVSRRALAAAERHLDEGTNA